MMLRTLLLLVPLLAVHAAMPSCEDEIGANCVSEDADMSPAGIAACLAGLSEKSELCTTYLDLMDKCKPDLAPDAICGTAAMDGEAMPCLIQRVKPEDLSAACAAALPSTELKGLAKYWADGKRQLLIDEIAELNADDKDTYNRWQKKKKGKKTDKDRERDYAVKKAKCERVESLIEQAVIDAKPSAIADALEVATATAKTALAEDMTGTLKPFTKPELHGIAKKAMAKLKDEM